MPPKSAAARRPSRRTYKVTARKSIPNPNSVTPIKLSIPSSTTTPTTAAIPPPSTAISTSSKSSQETRPVHTSNTTNALQKPLHATTPASGTQPQSSEKTLAYNSGLISSDVGSIDGNRNEELGKSVDPEDAVVEHFGPEKTIHVEAVTSGGNGDGRKNALDLSSVPVIRPHLQDEGSVKLVARLESGESGVAGPGNRKKKKKKIVKKIVRIVKKVIKKRVPKRVLVNGSENRELVVKEEGNTKSGENSNLANDVIKKCNHTVEVVKKNSVVTEAKGILNVGDNITENSDGIEKSNIEEVVAEKTGIVNEVVRKTKITDEAIQKLELVNNASVLEPVIGEKGNDLSGDYSVEIGPSKLSFGACAPEKMVLANDQSGTHSMDTEHTKSNNVITEGRNDLNVCVHDSMKVENVKYAAEPIIDTKEMKNTVMEHQLKGSFVENHNLDIDNKLDMGLFTDRFVGLVGEKSEDLVGENNGSIIRKPVSGSGEVENDRVRLNEGLLLSEEMKALERKKRRKTEIFVGGLHKDTQENDIRKGFEEAGMIVEVRLVMNGKTGKNNAFVRFATATDAKNALAKYSKVKICGKQCDAAPVEGNDTIYLGNIDRNWKTEDVVTLLEIAGIKKIDKVSVKADPNNIEKNRGFAFVELETSKAAQIAFNRLQMKEVFGKNLMVKVAWAHPLIEPDEEEMLKVKSVFAEYLPSSWDKEKVKEYFKRFGDIENVVLAKDLPSTKRKDFAFINYTTRDAALTCIEAVSQERLEDDCSKVKMAVSLANPISKRTKMIHTSDDPIKQPFKSKQKEQTSAKLHEPRNRGKPASSGYGQIRVDNRPYNTNKHTPPHPWRPQASTNNIQPHPMTGTDAPDYRYPLPGSKRPFSLVGHHPLYAVPQELSRVPMESFYPISGPSSSYHGVGAPSFPYHRLPGSGFTSDSVNGRRIYHSHFETREQASYYGDNNRYRRY